MTRPMREIHAFVRASFAPGGVLGSGRFPVVQIVSPKFDGGGSDGERDRPGCTVPRLAEGNRGGCVRRDACATFQKIRLHRSREIFVARGFDFLAGRASPRAVSESPLRLAYL